MLIGTTAWALSLVPTSSLCSGDASLPFTYGPPCSIQCSGMHWASLQDHDHHNTLLTKIFAPLSPETQHSILNGQATIVCLTSILALYHGTELSGQGFHDALFLHYAQSPWSSSSLWWLRSTLLCAPWPSLFSWWSCPCMPQSTVWWVTDLAVHAFTPNAAHDKPLIHLCPGCSTVTPPAHAASLPLPILSADWGDLLTCGWSLVLWYWLYFGCTWIPKPTNWRTL